MTDAREQTATRIPLSVAALGVVYGDIGTSPLYALRECFRGEARLPVVPENVLGVLSLVFWALVVVVSVKYLVYVLRADNEGEGGILALLALLNPWGNAGRPDRRVLLTLGIFGAALLYGDGMITPAISVLSAVEGLEITAPSLDHFVLPITAAILIGLFALQRRGTAGVGMLFGPVMALWFAVLAALGLRGIWMQPHVLVALDPLQAWLFLAHHRGAALPVVGAVFLVVTGGEALYADLGHFGLSPIRRMWFALVLPALVLNYFGQGALLLTQGNITQPFYRLAPGWAQAPLVGLATLATVIASQAVISGTFSLTGQAVRLGQFPRVTVRQTSASAAGQIYVPSVNWTLMLAAIGLVYGFGSSSGLAAAYGVAVSATMVITTLLAFRVARERWGWKLLPALALTAVFLVVDVGFFTANLTKVAEGGWFPLLVGGAIFVLMTTWHRGRQLLGQQLRARVQPLHLFLDEIREHPPLRIPGTAIFLTNSRATTPPILAHHLEHHRVLREQVVILNVVTEDAPRVPGAERAKLVKLSPDLFQVTLRYGFMEDPDVPADLARSAAEGLRVDPENTTYYVGKETLIATTRPGMALWRDHLFAFMSRNATRATAFFKLPPARVMELGIQIEI